MTICDYTDRLEEINGELVRIVTAHARKNENVLDVYREFENGKCDCRNLYSSMYGYRVGFPNEVNSLYTNQCMTFVEKLDDFGDCNKIDGFTSGTLSYSEKQLIIGKYTDFAYVLKKYNGSIRNTMAVLNIWKEHKEIEMVLASGFIKVALNKSFWRLTEKKRMEIVQFIRKNPTSTSLSVNDIQTMIKYGLNTDEYGKYKSWYYRFGKVGYDVYKYLQKIGKADMAGVWLYKDYKDMLKQTDHNQNDDYWKFPKDLRKKHDELRDEIERVKAVKEAEKLKEKQSKYYGAVKELLKYNSTIEGYSVFVPDSVEEISRHAKALHQCLVTADYISKVINNECVLVFVQKNGEPIATAELKKGNKIGQFYANELDRDNCLPTDEVKAVMNKWLEMKEAA